MTPTHRKEIGVASGVTAYLIWGFIAEYFKILGDRGVRPMVLLTHRVIWSTLFCIALLAALRGLSEAIATLRVPRRVLALIASAVLVAINWLTFIYSIETKQLTQSALGYFILPLVSVVLGLVVLKETLRRLQWLSLAFATAGVCLIVYSRGQLPWIALSIAVSFGLYGLIRKMIAVGPIVGLAVETALLAPAAIIYLLATHHTSGAANLTWTTYLLLALSGVITAVPLVLFVVAARALKLTAVGFLQYLAPTCQLLLAIFHHHEQVTHAQWLGFVPIWLGLVIFSIDSVMSRRDPPMTSADESPELLTLER